MSDAPPDAVQLLGETRALRQLLASLVARTAGSELILTKDELDMGFVILSNGVALRVDAVGDPPSAYKIHFDAPEPDPLAGIREMFGGKQS